MGAIATLEAPRQTASPIVSAKLRHRLGNLLVAASFLIAGIPNAMHFGRSPADAIWTIGAVLMGAMSLVRIAPKAARIDLRAFLSTIFPVFLLPCLLRADGASSGLLAWTGVSLELFGVALSQVSRVYMGRHFGILPGNRGNRVEGSLRTNAASDLRGMVPVDPRVPGLIPVVDELPDRASDAALHDVADSARGGTPRG